MRTTEHNWILKKENRNAQYTFIVVDQAASISNGKPNDNELKSIQSVRLKMRQAHTKITQMQIISGYNRSYLGYFGTDLMRPPDSVLTMYVHTQRAANTKNAESQVLP